MLQRWFLALTAVLVVGGTLLLADDEVYVRGKEKAVKGKITKESPAGVIVGTKDTVAAEDIAEVVYDLTPNVTANVTYRAAVKAEKDAAEPANEAKRKQLLADAGKKYEEAFKLTTDKHGKRQIEYKLAMLKVRAAQDEGDEPEKAIAALKNFTKKHPGGWQIGAATETLGRLQVEAKDYEGAEETYKALAALDDVPEEMKKDAELAAVQVKIRAGKHAEAKALLQAMQKTLPKGSKFAARARVAEAECLVEEKKLDEAVKLVREVIKDSTDREVKAVGHNTLGYCYYKQGQPKEARWEFLWVDVEYNQDRNQHAKALYYLWRIFGELGEAERAQGCREALLSPQFAGLDYQRQARKDAK